MSIEASFQIRRGGFSLDAQLNIADSGVTTLFGPSGCGKTSLLRAIAGLDRHADSRLIVKGETWQDDQVFRAAHERPIGYVFQEPSLFEHLSVRRNLEYGHKRVPAADQRISLEDVIELLSLGKLLSRDTRGLSGGEKQRVAIARALAVSPRLLLMDEPLAALDLARKQEILPYIEMLHDELEIPVIYVSHSPDEVARISDFMVLMDQGSVLDHGPVGDMLTRLDLPLAIGADAEALLEAEVAEHDTAYHLTYLDFAGGRFAVPHKDLPIGDQVRLRVAARDVSLTLERQSGTSILNIFPAQVDALTPAGKAQVVVKLSAEGVPLLARITRKSAESLGLETGKKVYAQAKSVALLA